MIDFLIKKIIKNSDDTNNPFVRAAYGQFSSIFGIISNIILAIGKVLIGTISNSIAIVADGINNLSDSASSIITLIGFKISNKPADEDHPFGHARSEYIAGLVVSFIVLLIGIELISTSVDKILNPSPTDFNALMIVVLIFSILVKALMYYVNIKLSEKISSSTIKAAAKDSLNDVISTFAILISIFLTKLTNFETDGYIGILVALIIINSGLEILKETLSPLLGEPPSKEMICDLANKIMSYDGIINIHDLVVHNYGPNRNFATVHVEVYAKEDIMKSHDTIDNIERDILNEMGINLVIHLDPIIIDDAETNELKIQVEKILGNIDSKLTLHDFRIVKGTTHTKIIFDVVVPASFELSEKELKNTIYSEIRSIDNTYYPIIVLDYNYNILK